MKKTKLKIHIYPDKVLRQKSKEVKEITQEIKDLLEEMSIFMKINKGIGLAANQVGIPLKLIVCEIDGKIWKLINPKIISKKGKIDSQEGCLSFPGLNIKVKRAKNIWVNALDENGNNIDLEGEDLGAVVLQHEIDHINGVLFIDRLPWWERIKIRPMLKKIKENNQRGGVNE